MPASTDGNSDSLSELPEVTVESVPPEDTHHNQHPAFDNEIMKQVKRAFRDEVPRYEQISFLESYEYPYQNPVVAEVEWYAEKELNQLRSEMEFTDTFVENI